MTISHLKVLKKFSVDGVVKSDYSVSSLSEKESRVSERERELDKNYMEKFMDQV